ncbi:hypothetical protein L1987_74519 [Smallanthus sonchifolius]|uniref:Uncharacterized protein n=1 Tax=Smallanthus sonchifolius TaxID=185202 RepID=A0ACB9A3A6_9ASTR|nr:hypothetical protein L1987_74519 [Smallanthus sonchifolius]
MFEFGDELIIDSHRIPWLIWIQLLAMFLLVILLYFFTTIPSDLSLHFSTSDSAAANTRRNSKVRENEIKETGASTSEVVQRAKKPDGRPRAGSSTTNENSGMIGEHSHHPCHFFGFAKHVFLKCLGIESTPEKDE